MLCVIGLVAWEWWVAKQTPRPRPPTSAQLSPAPTPLAGSSPSAVPLTASSPPPAATGTPAPEATPAFAEKIETLRNDDVELRLTNRGGGIREAVLLNHIGQGGDRLVINSKDQPPIGAMVEQPNSPKFDEFTLIREADGSLRCERAAENVTIRKKFFFPPGKEKKDNFLAEMDVDLVNAGAQPYSNPGYFVALGAAVPIHPKDYSYYTRLVWCVDGKAKGVDVGWFGGGGGVFGIGQRAPQPFYQQDLANADWAAVSDQFFTTLIAPLTAKGNGVWGRRFDISPEQKTYGLSGALRMPAFQLPPGQTYSAKFEIWAGPKIYHRLARLDHNEAEIMDFGIFKIGMSLLNPKIQELREKYKDDPTRMNQEVMRLYKDYGINPVGGCLPMMIQIPIFFGLFKMLGQAVELRNAQFFWVHDLSQPDTVGYLPVLDWPINIIPLCMAATQIWLMAMTPKTGDATQRRVMMFTPLIFLFICYNFAAALALYYTAQNLFSIVQFYYNKRQPMPTLEKRAPAGKRK